MTAVLAIGAEAEKDWRISIDKGVVLVQFTPGTIVDFEVLKGVFGELNSDPAKYRTKNIVWDVRNVVPASKAGYMTMSKVVRHFVDQREDWWKNDKTAVVVSSKLAYGLGRIYAALVDGKLDYEVKIFEKDFEAAFLWARTSD